VALCIIFQNGTVTAWTELKITQWLKNPKWCN